MQKLFHFADLSISCTAAPVSSLFSGKISDQWYMSPGRVAVVDHVRFLCNEIAKRKSIAYTSIRQEMGTEHLIHLSRTGDNPVHWIQLVHAFDQPGVPGLQWWPLITHIKLQMLKCDKCLLEFCSPINYRRHARVHHRSSKVNKESQSLRSLLVDFWDKCSLEETKQLVSFDDVMLKETPGSSVIMALASSLLKPEISALPQVYVNAGAKLLDLTQAPLPGLKISSEELFCILDNASEGTFLLPSPAEFVQKYVFDGEATNGLELRNLVASTSFLFELQLVKAWVAAKDAEALRCQKLLVEEEEAARRRKTKLVERRKQKKLRQKELKAKEQLDTCKQDMNFTVCPSDEAVLTEESTPSSSPSHSSSNLGDVSADFATCLSMLVQSKELEKLIGAQIDLRDESANHCDSQSIGSPVHLNCCRSLSMQNQQVSEMSSWHDLTADQNLHSKPESTEEFNPYTHSSPPNRSTVWMKEHTLETGGDSLESSMNEDTDQQIESNNFELVIGSISVPLNTSLTSRQRHPRPADAQDVFGGELSLLDRRASERLITVEATRSVTNRVACKPVKPTSHDETEKYEDRNTHSEVCVLPRSKDGNDYDNHRYLFVVSDGNTPEENLPFSAFLAKEFLSQRWKQAVSEDHVKLNLASGHGPERFITVQYKN